MMYEIILLLVSVISAVATYHVNNKLGKGPVLASAFLSLIVALIFYFFPLQDQYLNTAIPLAFIGGSFLGMTSVKVVPDTKWIAFSGLIFGFVFINTGSLFKGFGGGLGATACLAEVVTLGLMFVMKKTVKETKIKKKK